VTFTVVICTRNRVGSLGLTLAALESQTECDFSVLVIDQSEGSNPQLERRTGRPRFAMIRDSGRGLSRARNIAWRSTDATWLVYLDDDCVPEPTWAAELGAALENHPEAQFISGHVDGGSTAPSDHLSISTFLVENEKLLSGRWVRPWDIGLGLLMAIRRSTIEQLGGWDERLGAGTAPFPAAEDMDFNYRFLRAGGVAFITPRIRATHEQWRSAHELAPHLGGYMEGWSGFAMKHLRSGDVLGGLWLWHWGLRDLARMFASAAKRRSPLRLRIAAYKAAGLARGTCRGALRSW